ncbi:response regulator [Tellurirhabdus rosea]|uniref:hypothetical protein n=1 Tax=Tellurirhabdus rosea TaxID=2674997 RepID=UPI002251CE25|nr:hypothetical protein [Tellurirhabdus rosea]
MRRIIVVTNRTKESAPILRRHLSHQYPNHELHFQLPSRSLRAELASQPDANLPHLILLDHCDAGADMLQNMRELKNDPNLCRIPVLMLTAVATQKQLISFL